MVTWPPPDGHWQSPLKNRESPLKNRESPLKKQVWAAPCFLRCEYGVRLHGNNRLQVTCDTCTRIAWLFLCLSNALHFAIVCCSEGCFGLIYWSFCYFSSFNGQLRGGFFVLLPPYCARVGLVARADVPICSAQTFGCSVLSCATISAKNNQYIIWIKTLLRGLCS